MKALISSLAKALFLPVMLLVIVTSCTKPGVEKNTTPIITPPTGGGGTTPPTTFVINATPVPDTVWNANKSKVEWNANKPVSMEGGPATTSGSVETGVLNSDPETSTVKNISLNYILDSVSYKKDVVVVVRSARLSLMCYDSIRGQNAKWKMSALLVSTDSLNWGNENLECNLLGFRPNGFRVSYVTGCDGNPNPGTFYTPYGPAGETHNINMGVNNDWKVIGLTSTTLTIMQKKLDSDGVIRWRIKIFTTVA